MRGVRTLFAMAVTLCALGSAVAFERAPVEVARALGTTRGKSVSSGLVFIDGKYVKPPYRVMRVGNQILLNDHPVTGQLVSWNRFLDTQPPSNLRETEVEEPDGSPAGETESNSAPEKDGYDPAAPKDGGNAPPPADEGGALVRPVVTIEAPRLAAEADELDDFDLRNAPTKMKLSDIPPDSETDRARQKRAEDEKRAEEEEEKEEAAAEKDGEGANDSGRDENGDDVDPASPEGEAAARKAAAKAPPPSGRKTRKVKTLAGKFDMNAQARKLIKPINAYRAKLESTLRRGGYLFIGTDPSGKYLVGRTSESVAAGELLKKLPELMRDAKDPDSFCDTIRSAGLFSYISRQIAQDLYRHKRTYYDLIQRRKEIAEDAKLKKLMR